MLSNVLSPELVVSPYETIEKRVVLVPNGNTVAALSCIDCKLVNVEYHLPNWWKCFHPNISDSVFEKAVRGYWNDHPRYSRADVVYKVQRMSDDMIRDYAKSYDEFMDDVGMRLRTGAPTLDWLTIWG